MQPIMHAELEVRPITVRRVVASAQRILIAVLVGLGLLSLVPLQYRVRVPAHPIALHRELHDAYAKAARFVDVAFARWAASHPAGACPDSMTELRLASGERSSFDPWGGVFELVCEPARLRVHSPGPDGVFGTADDVERTAPR